MTAPVAGEAGARNRVVHATNELVAAVWGIYAECSDGDGDGTACGRPGGATFAWLASHNHPSKTEDRSPVTCSECLSLLRDARGPDWDVITSNLAALDARREA